MISLIIRTFNNEKFIEKAVMSALNQNFNDYEVVVINDGSTDNTKKILNSFSHPKLRIIHQENQGMIKAGYAGLRESKEDYVIFLDGDDEFKTNTLSELFTALRQNLEKGFSYSDYDEIDLRNENKKIVSCQNIFNTLACGILFRRTVLNEVGFWDRKFIFAEYDLLIRIMKKYPGVHVAKPLYVYNRHENSFTANKEKVEQGKQQLFVKYGFFEWFKEY